MDSRRIVDMGVLLSTIVPATVASVDYAWLVDKTADDANSAGIPGSSLIVQGLCCHKGVLCRVVHRAQPVSGRHERVAQLDVEIAQLVGVVRIEHFLGVQRLLQVMCRLSVGVDAHRPPRRQLSVLDGLRQIIGVGGVREVLGQL